MKSKWQTTGRIATAIVALTSAGIGYGCATHTFVRWWEPIMWALGIGLASTPMVMKFFAGCLSVKSKWLCMTVSLAFAAAIAYGALMSLNFFLSDRTSAVETTAVVTSKYKEQRTRYRRIGRNRRVADGTYDVYYITTRFDNGIVRDFPVSAQSYANARQGDKKKFTLEKGFFGYTVFKKQTRNSLTNALPTRQL